MMLRFAAIRDLALTAAGIAVVVNQMRIHKHQTMPQTIHPPQLPKSRTVESMITEFGGQALSLEELKSLDTLTVINVERQNVRLLWRHLDQMTEQERDATGDYILAALRRFALQYGKEIITHPANDLFSPTYQEQETQP